MADAGEDSEVFLSPRGTTADPAMEEGESGSQDHGPTTEAVPPKKKGRPPAATGGPPEHPCLACGENCGKKQATVKCVMCTLWAHKSCVKMPDALYKTLDTQFKETGSAFWVCRPCQNFGQRVQHQFAESNKRHDETEKRVNSNEREIQNSKTEINKLRREMEMMKEKMNTESAVREDRMCDEMQEREVRRMNLILHGVQEPADSVKGNRERMERDKDTCEEIFRTINARTTKDRIRFCRRIGEKGTNPRPVVIGLEDEGEKRNILSKA